MFRNGVACKVNDSMLDQNGRYIIYLYCTTSQSPKNQNLVLANPADFCSISVNNSGLTVL
jgi:hypothetical protein